MSKRTTTKVAGGRNGGIHDVRQYKAACKWLETHTFTNGQLWHLVFFGSNDRKDYEAGLDRLCERLRDKGMRVEWRAAFEHDLEKLDPERRFHRHVFMMIEANNKKPIGTINYKTDKTGLFALLARHNLKFYICEPQDELGIHGAQPYMYVPKKPGQKLDDCKAWISYIYKARSKEGVVGRIYSSSRNKTAKPALAAAQPVEQAEEVTSTTATVESTDTVSVSMRSIDGLRSSIYRGTTTWRRYVQHRAGRTAFGGSQSAHCEGGRTDSFHATTYGTAKCGWVAEQGWRRPIMHDARNPFRNETSPGLYSGKDSGPE